MKTVFISLLLFVSTLSCWSQDESYFEIAKAESELKLLFDKLYDLEDNANKIQLFEEIDSIFNTALSLPGSFEFAWHKLDKIGKLKSDDGVLKVFSWLMMINRNEYRYVSYFQLNGKKGKSSVYKLIPSGSFEVKDYDFVQKLDDWHAKIYYEIITSVYKRKTFYTLIGADYHDSRSTMKTVEVVAIQRGKPLFRKDQFLDKGSVKNRMIMQYSSDLSASVRYNSELNLIVFDHLVPLHPLYSGSYQFYGPDGSYDGLRFEEGMWVKEEDVDAKNR